MGVKRLKKVVSMVGKNEVKNNLTSKKGDNMRKIKDRILAMVMIIPMLLPSLIINSQVIISQASQIETQSFEEDYTQYVDPFVGTDVDYGQLFPGSVTPNGLMKLSPDTYPHQTDDHAGYDYSKTQIAGFSHTRIEGVGGQGAGGDVLITPTYVQYSSKPVAASKAQKFSHDKEAAEPGYYSVELTPKTGTGTNYVDNSSIGNIKAELTSNTRTGYHKYTFPQDGKVSLIVDLNYTYHGTDIRNAIMEVEQLENITAISGRFSGRNVSGHGKYTMYFYMETSQPATGVQTWLDSNIGNDIKREGNDIGAVLSFDALASTPIEVKVSISPVSSKQAKSDMYNGMPGWSFEEMRNSAKAEWNEILGKVKVENSTQSDPGDKLKKLFYTHLYHMFTTPVNATSTDNTFRATDLNVYKADDYTHYDSWTLWDDFRKYPMIGLILPEVYKDYIRSLANTMEYGIGTWGIETQTVPTVRTEHAVALLADGVAKGFDDVDNLDIAYNKSKEIADKTVNSAAESLGYIEGRVDKTVEFSYDDWAISLLADNLGKTEDYNKYLARSFFYKNLFKADAVTTTVNSIQKTFGLLWPKDSNGNWKTADPEKYGDNSLYQGTLWQYTWWDSNDVNGLLDLIGSKELMADQLKYLYGMHAPEDGKRMLHTNTNEIDLHTPYLFNFVGEPYNTQYWVRQIYTKQTWNRYSGTGEYNPPIKDYVYKLDPQGFLETMDEDAGTMAAMYVSAAMGLFPMAPGDTTFQVGTPFFEKITLDVGNGREFVIEANNVSSDNFYIQSATLNGESFDRTWVDYSEIIRGGTLKFEMGPTPSDWAKDGVTALSSSDMVDTSIYDKTDPLRYSATTIFESENNDGSIDQEVIISLQNTSATISGVNNEDLIAAGKVTVGNVPDGLTLKATKVNDTSIKLNFEGNSLNHRLSNSIGDLSLKLEDTLFSQPITSKRKEKNNIKIMFRDDSIQFSKDRLYESELNDGSVTDMLDINLTGSTTFNGSIGEDFVLSNKVNLSNLPAGLTANAAKISDQQILLSISGTADIHNADIDNLVVSFNDSAFDGARACDINGSNYGGMKSLIIDFIGDWKERLVQIIDEGKLINPSDLTSLAYAKLQAELLNGQAVLDDADSTEDDYENAYNKIYNLINNLVYSQNAFKQLEAESFTVWSGGKDLKTEGGKDSNNVNLNNIGGTYDGAWIGFEKLDFSNKEVATFSVRYVNNSGRCATDASMEIRLGSASGELLQTVTLPETGNNWNNYVVKTVELVNSEKLKGVVDIYFVLKGTGATGEGAGKVFIANIDWMKFNQANTYGIYQAENYSNWSAGSLKIESSNTSEGESLTNIGGTSDGAWISFEQLKFSGEGLGKVAIRYAANNGRCPDDTRIEVRLDSSTGELIDTIAIPPTASNWNNYVIVEKNLQTSVKGLHNIYFVLRGTTNGSKPYIANIDWFKFSEGENLINSAVLDPDNISFDKLDPKDADTTITWNDAAFVTDITKDGISIGADAYEVDGSVLTIKKEYLENQSIGNQILSVEFDKGDAATLIVNISDSTVPTKNSATISPSSFDINMENAGEEDIETTITWNDATMVTDIKQEDMTIGADAYVVSGSALTISKDFIKDQTVGTHTLTVEFDEGNAAILTLKIIDSTQPEPEVISAVISPKTAVFDKYFRNMADVDTAIIWNDAASITDIKDRGSSIGSENYSISGNVLTIKKEYLMRKPYGNLVLNIDFNVGDSEILAINIVNTTPSSPSPGSSSGSAPVNNEPQIVGNNNATGWDAIAKDITAKSEGSNVSIDMKNNTIIKKEILAVLKGKDITTEFQMNGYKWIINGKDITKDELNNIDLGVTFKENILPETVVDTIGKNSKAKQIQLVHNGEFGFNGKLELNLRKENNGLVANLFYFDPVKKKLILQDVTKVDENGNASLNFNHASDYVIIMENKVLLEKEVSNMAVKPLKTLYLGGTTGKSAFVNVELPEVISKAVEQGLSNMKITYTSSNKKIAAVEKSGKITAKGTGTATIKTTITIDGIKKTFSNKVKVTKAYIKFTKAATSMKLGETFVFAVECYGFNQSDVIYTTTARSRVAIAKKSGKAIAKSKGIDYVVATCDTLKKKTKVIVK